VKNAVAQAVADPMPVVCLLDVLVSMLVDKNPMLVRLPTACC
jgi:hypothetical protein